MAFNFWGRQAKEFARSAFSTSHCVSNNQLLELRRFLRHAAASSRSDTQFLQGALEKSQVALGTSQDLLVHTQGLLGKSQDALLQKDKDYQALLHRKEQLDVLQQDRQGVLSNLMTVQGTKDLRGALGACI
jgi:hypothetical protein